MRTGYWFCWLHLSNSLVKDQLKLKVSLCQSIILLRGFNLQRHVHFSFGETAFPCVSADGKGYYYRKYCQHYRHFSRHRAKVGQHGAKPGAAAQPHRAGQCRLANQTTSAHRVRQKSLAGDFTTTTAAPSFYCC